MNSFLKCTLWFRSVSFNNKMLINKRLIVFLICFCIINFICISYRLYVKNNLKFIGKQCYEDLLFATNDPTKLEGRLHDVMESAKQPTPGRSIFFHETSCSVDGTIKLNAR